MSTHPIGLHLKGLDQLFGSCSSRIHLKKYQLVVLSCIPIIILVGQLMSLYSPDETIHNYFTSKGNLINTVFVKQGWLWTILTYFYTVIHKLRTKKIKVKVFIISFARVFLLTFCWFLFTQWFFGPPLMDRAFVLTGGKCYSIHQSRIPSDTKLLFSCSADKCPEGFYDSKEVSSSYCKSVKGSWEGGHDPSGHMFLLTLSIMLLIGETVELYNSEDKLLDTFNKKNISLIEILLNPLVITASVVFLSLSMLLMTVIKYHSFNEQISGFSVAVLSLWSVYRITNIIK